MKIQELIDRSLKPINDLMDGKYRMYMPSNSNKCGIKSVLFVILHCEICGDEQVHYWNHIKQPHRKQLPCSFKGDKKCRLIYEQRKVQPMEYSGKIITIDSVPQKYRDKCHDPVKSYIKDQVHASKPEVKKQKHLLAKERQSAKEWKQFRKKRDEEYIKKNQGKVTVRRMLNNILAKRNKPKKISVTKHGFLMKEIILHLRNNAVNLGYKSIADIVADKFDVDHIIPSSYYNLDINSEMVKCNHPLNLRWLPSSENRSRQNKIRPQDLEVIKTLPENIYPKDCPRNVFVGITRAGINRVQRDAEPYKL